MNRVDAGRNITRVERHKAAWPWLPVMDLPRHLMCPAVTVSFHCHPAVSVPVSFAIPKPARVSVRGLLYLRDEPRDRLGVVNHFDPFGLSASGMTPN
jgi:hypothetical protein